MKPTLVIIHGIPGTGKTTLAYKLAKDLKLPCLGKDMLKEFLFDTLGTRDLEWSQTLGGATLRMLYVFIDHMMQRGESIIIECPFYTEAARPILAKTLDETGANCIELYCKTDPAVRRERFRARIKDGTRHPGHTDPARMSNGPEPTQYPPLEIGELITVDTTHFNDQAYQKLLTQVRAVLGKTMVQ
jgi:predicted kinase